MLGLPLAFAGGLLAHKYHLYIYIFTSGMPERTPKLFSTDSRAPEATTPLGLWQGNGWGRGAGQHT